MASLAGTILAGCGPLVLVTNENVREYDPSYVVSMKNHGGMAVNVIGNPTTLPDAQARRAVVSQLSAPPHSGEMPVYDAGDRSDSYRLVIAFDRVSWGRAGLCAKDTAQFRPRPTGPSIVVDAAFCLHDSVISEVRLEFARVAPDHPDFRHAMRRVVMHLLPPNKSPDGDCPGGCGTGTRI
ncbi:MAG: hypothetical protein FJX46_02590 [Alphaproteobacteria bacterium]|nr:hypothetical protein [Alphaproteobacteria bacterium]